MRVSVRWPGQVWAWSSFIYSSISGAAEVGRMRRKLSSRELLSCKAFTLLVSRISLFQSLLAAPRHFYYFFFFFFSHSREFEQPQRGRALIYRECFYGVYVGRPEFMFGLKCSLQPFIAGAEKQQSADEKPGANWRGADLGLGMQKARLLLGSQGGCCCCLQSL